jgi:hypothetical protein
MRIRSPAAFFCADRLGQMVLSLFSTKRALPLTGALKYAGTQECVGDSFLGGLGTALKDSAVPLPCAAPEGATMLSFP